MQPEPIIYVVDDDDAVRQSLEFLLGVAGIQTRGFETATAFLELMPTIRSGCVITDVRMPGISGIELLRRVKKNNPELPVIVITGHGDIALAVEAMKIGAFDFLEKPFDDENILLAVRSALDKGADDGKRATKLAETKEKLATLSQREREVLDGLVSGNANKAIAFDLGISPRTVEIYRANVMTKMAADSLSDLVRMAIVAGHVGNKDGAEN